METGKGDQQGCHRHCSGRSVQTVAAIWSIPTRLIVALVAVEVLAVTAAVVDGVLWSPVITPTRLWTAAVLVLASVVHTEISLGVERVRRRVTETPHIDLSSVWTFAAAVLLPPIMASVVVVAIYGHLYVRVWRPSKIPAYRLVFSTATVLIAVHAAAAVVVAIGAPVPFGTDRGLLTTVAALLAYTVVNTFLIVGVIVMSTPGKTFRQVLGRGNEVVLEVATLSMGALVAGTLASSSPAHALLVLPPLVVLHRAVLVRQLEVAASTDGKTGLLNAAAWHTQAGRALVRAQRAGGNAAVLILDLDHFKLVNDHHGHLAGDSVLSSIATALRSEVRENDLVGRFGGEEFVVLLPGLDGRERGGCELEAVAERIRRRVDGLRVEVPTPDGPLTVDDLSVSVGGATFPSDGADLRQLLEVADSALYAAKRAGRNAIRVGPHPEPPTRARAEDRSPARRQP